MECQQTAGVREDDGMEGILPVAFEDHWALAKSYFPMCTGQN